METRMIYSRNENGHLGKLSQAARVHLAGGMPEECRAMAKLLAASGFVVTVSESMDKTFARAAGEIVDLVIVPENTMQDDLFEVYSGLRGNESTESVPVLLVCGSDTRLDWLKGMPGVFDIVRQPYHAEDLLARVRVLLNHKRLSDNVQDLQRQLYAAQKLGCVGALTASVAHEFNNLMCAVMGFAEIAKDNGATDLDALRESAEVSYDAAKRAAATAATLLAFSRGNTERKTMGSVNAVITDAVRLVRKNITSSGVNVTLELGELPPTNIASGPLQQVFLNLIINAWQAMLATEGERQLTVTTRCENRSRIIIDVRDTGIGISVADQDRMFEAFYTTKNGKDGCLVGSGLGLPLVLTVVVDHGGIVQVDSVLGKGSCFTVMLPVQEHGEAGLVGGPKPSGGRKRSVLIVDDEEGSRRVLCRLLLKLGHDCCAVATMAEAASLLVDRKFDLIVMDLIMPDRDGASNIRSLRDEGIQCPILICTGQMDNGAIEMGLQAGANGVIHKPFSGAQFIASMNMCLK